MNKAELIDTQLRNKANLQKLTQKSIRRFHECNK